MIALKEWAIAVEALVEGEQIIILRKGGIHEETRQFALKSNYFMLFPAFEHQKEQLVQPAYQERLKSLREKGMSDPLPVLACAEVVREWLINDINLIEKLAPFHIWNEQMVEMRLHWKKTQPLHVIALRVFRLDQAELLKEPQSYAGCKSWFELPFEENEFHTRLTQVISEEMLQNKIVKIDELLKS